MDHESSYPVGSIVEVDHDKYGIVRARVTGHDVLEQRESGIQYAESALGPKVNVSTNPPDMEATENDHLEGREVAISANVEDVTLLEEGLEA